MKNIFSLAITIFIASQILSADTLDSDIDTLVGPVDAPLNTWTDSGASTALTLPSGGANVLVYSTFSTGTEDDTLTQARVGMWRLTDGSTYSLPIGRFVSKGGDDAGVASTVHLFEIGTSGAKTFKLQHESIPSPSTKLAQTFDVSLVALSLKTDDLYALAKAQDTTAAYEFESSSTSFTPVLKATSTELKASITTPAAAGKIMAICSFNCLIPAVASDTGQWVLQIQEAGVSATRTEICLPISRDMTRKRDLGACSLIGLADHCNGAPLKPNQAYEILLMFKAIEGDATIQTKNVTISAFATSYMDTKSTPAPHAFPARCGFITEATSTATSGMQDTGLSYDQYLAESTKVFLSATYNCAVGSGTTERNGEFRLNEGSYNSQQVKRFLADEDDIGSAANAGLTPAGSGTKTFKMQYDPVDSLNIKVINPTLRTVVLASASSPPTQAKDIVFDTVGDNSVTLSWEQGDGLAKLVIARADSAPSSGPVDTTTYTADNDFSGSGTALGGGKVVYIGTDNSVTVTGLDANTTYYFEVYEYNFSGSYIDYNIATATDNPNSQLTTPEPGIFVGLLLAGLAMMRSRKRFAKRPAYAG